MSFPRTPKELSEAGYEYLGPGFCRGCKKAVEWFRTPGPKPKENVLNPEWFGTEETEEKKIALDQGTLIPHWSTCPKADEFRRNKHKS